MIVGILSLTLLLDAGTPIDVNRMQGIYLPHLWPESSCSKVPLVLAYHTGHFEPLVAAGGVQFSLPQVPLVNSTLERLPVRFLGDEQVGSEFALLDRYLNCEYSLKGYLVAAYYDCLNHEFATTHVMPKIPSNPLTSGILADLSRSGAPQLYPGYQAW